MCGNFGRDLTQPLHIATVLQPPAAIEILFVMSSQFQIIKMGDIKAAELQTDLS